MSARDDVSDESFEGLIELLADDLAECSNEDVMAEVERDGDDPHEMAASVREIFNDAVELSQTLPRAAQAPDTSDARETVRSYAVRSVRAIDPTDEGRRMTDDRHAAAGQDTKVRTETGSPKDRKRRSGGSGLRRGKLSVADSNEWLDVIEIGRGLKEISELRYRAELTLSDLEAVPREEYQDATTAYFSTPVEIFSSDNEEATHLPRWLLRICPFFSIWPKPLELRIEEYDARRYGNTDADVRNSLQKLIEIFSANLWANIKRKRWIQLWWVLVQGIVSALTVYFLPLAPSALAGLGCIALYAILTVGIIKIFHINTRNQFKYHYAPALKNSCDAVSRAISDRMRTLSVIVEQQARIVDGLRAKGEAAPAGSSNDDDKRYWEGHAFQGVQMMIWLPIRVLGLETCLRNKFETARKIYAKRDARGFFLTWLIFFCSATPAVYFLIDYAGRFFRAAGSALQPLDFGVPGLLLMQLAIIVTFLVVAFVLSRRSYYNLDWNSGKDTLKEHFDTSTWATFANSGFDRRLAVRVQLAMDYIYFLNNQPRIR